MFVECFSGLMGGGKSFYSVIRAAEHIAKGGVFFSNIRFQLDPWFNDEYAHLMKSFWLPECYEGCRMEMHKGGLLLPVIKRDKDGLSLFEYNSRGLRYFLERVYKWKLQEGQYHYIEDENVNADLPSHLPKGSQRRPVLVILDEALDHFESNGTQTSATSEFRSFLRHIRKLGINLIFIAQDFGSLDKKIRMLTHFVWKFRDMYTWPVPVFNRPLPPPWRDHIVCEKFHRSQFGKMRAEPINKNTWVVRDPLVFGCYQSIATHNASIKMADDMCTDFGDLGRMDKEKKKMNILEKVALYVCLLLSCVAAFRGGGKEVVRETVIEKAAPSSPGVEGVESVQQEKPRVDVRYGRFRYAVLNGRVEEIDVEGVIYKKGQHGEGGTVLSVTPDMIHMVDLDGNTTFIYPASVSSYEVNTADGVASRSRRSEAAIGSQMHPVDS